MDEQDKLPNDAQASNVQMHKLSPAEGLTFGALLDKFYMTFESTKNAQGSSETQAQDLLKSKKSGK